MSVYDNESTPSPAGNNKAYRRKGPSHSQSNEYGEQPVARTLYEPTQNGVANNASSVQHAEQRQRYRDGAQQQQRQQHQQRRSTGNNQNSGGSHSPQQHQQQQQQQGYQPRQHQGEHHYRQRDQQGQQERKQRKNHKRQHKDKEKDKTGQGKDTEQQTERKTFDPHADFVPKILMREPTPSSSIAAPASAPLTPAAQPFTVLSIARTTQSPAASASPNEGCELSQPSPNFVSILTSSNSKETMPLVDLQESDTENIQKQDADTDTSVVANTQLSTPLVLRSGSREVLSTVLATTPGSAAPQLLFSPERKDPARAYSPSITYKATAAGSHSPAFILSSSAAQPVTVPVAPLAPSAPVPPPLSAPSPPIKLLSGQMKLLNHDVIDRLLFDQSTAFTVISALGTQSAGKSTLLNAFIHSPSPSPHTHSHTTSSSNFSIQSNEHRRHQHHCTVGIDFIATPEHVLLLDTQPIHSASILQQLLRDEQSTSTANLEIAVEMQNVQIPLLCMLFSHVLLLVTEWPIPADLVQTMKTVLQLQQTMEARMLRSAAALANHNNPHGNNSKTKKDNTVVWPVGSASATSTPMQSSSLSTDVVVVINKVKEEADDSPWWSMTPAELQQTVNDLFLECSFNKNGLINNGGGYGPGNVNMFVLPLQAPSSLYHSSVADLRHQVLSLQKTPSTFSVTPSSSSSTLAATSTSSSSSAAALLRVNEKEWYKRLCASWSVILNSSTMREYRKFIDKKQQAQASATASATALQRVQQRYNLDAEDVVQSYYRDGPARSYQKLYQPP